MQLETDYVDQECGCRDFHQPHYSSGTKLLQLQKSIYSLSLLLSDLEEAELVPLAVFEVVMTNGYVFFSYKISTEQIKYRNIVP